jgi:hypothetical protein
VVELEEEQRGTFPALANNVSYVKKLHAELVEEREPLERGDVAAADLRVATVEQVVWADAGFASRRGSRQYRIRRADARRGSRWDRFRRAGA